MTVISVLNNESLHQVKSCHHCQLNNSVKTVAPVLHPIKVGSLPIALKRLKQDNVLIAYISTGERSMGSGGNGPYWPSKRDSKKEQICFHYDRSVH